MENLTAQEIDTLIDALGAWENKDLSGMIMGSMLKGIISKEGNKESAEREMEKDMEEFDRKRKARTEQSILLKAKLISMKNGIDADILARQVKNRA